MNRCEHRHRCTCGEEFVCWRGECRTVEGMMRYCPACECDAWEHSRMRIFVIESALGEEIAQPQTLAEFYGQQMRKRGRHAEAEEDPFAPRRERRARKPGHDLQRVLRYGYS